MTSSEFRKLSMLLSNIKNGSRQSFGEIYAMYEKKVYFLCCKILKSKSEAKNMTVEIFDHTYLQLANFNNAANFEKWLYNTLFGKCRRYLIDNRPEVFGDYIDSDSPDGEQVDILLAQDADEMMNYPDGIDISVDMMQTVDSILSELPHKMRNVVLLHYFCGFDGDEIAAIEQISFPAFKNRLYKARIRLATEEHKYTEIGYDVKGIVTFLPDVLTTMADSIVIPTDIASAVTSRTGVNCLAVNKNTDNENTVVSDTQQTAYINLPQTQKSSNYHTTNYATAVQPKKSVGQDISPAVKVIMAIVAILIIIGGTVAVVLGVQQHNKVKSEQGSVISNDNTLPNTTIEITTKPHTTEQATETTTEITTETTTETTTQETTAETTTQETTQPVTTEPETTTVSPEPNGGNDIPAFDEGIQNEG